MDTRSQKEDSAIVSLDESFLFYDSLARRVFRIEEVKRPVVRITGSHKHSCLLCPGYRRKTIIRQYDKINTDKFLDFLKTINHKFPKC